MGDNLIPARGGSKNRDAVDSAFLLRYAKRLESLSAWTITGHVLLGGLAGYGLGSAALAVKGLMGAFTGGMLNIAALMGQQPPVQAEAMIWVYLPWMAAAVGAIIWGGRGFTKSDEMRFQAQMALHLLRLQELVKEQSNG